MVLLIFQGKTFRKGMDPGRKDQDQSRGIPEIIQITTIIEKTSVGAVTFWAFPIMNLKRSLWRLADSLPSTVRKLFLAVEMAFLPLILPEF